MKANVVQKVEKKSGSDTNIYKLAVSDTKKTPETLVKRAKAKFLTYSFIFDLIRLESPLKRSYLNSVLCVNQLLYDHEKGKIVSRYCKNRWCLVCNRIRTGKLMNHYVSELSKFKDLYFVTLTIRNVSGDVLSDTLKDIQNKWEILRKRYKKQNLQFDGIRKNECTYSLRLENYHPHLHIVIRGKKQAEILFKDWLELYPNQTSNKAQDIRKANDETLKELFKYFTKVVKKDKNTPKNDYPVLVKQLDVMNQAYYNRKVFIPFGSFRDIEIDENIEDITSEQLENSFDGHEWNWVQDQSDWVSEYGELLTGNDYYKKIKVIIK